ncbi:MAG: NAD+ synthase [SAR202 cluster bacterium]|nr:NAD+ synthase [SAR202 cluster bacterium]
MRTLRLALAQINTTVGDLKGNTSKIIEHIERARDAKADIVAFPELAVTGYPPEDLLFKPQLIRENIERMKEVARATKGIAAVVGFVDANSDAYNAAAIAHNGEIVGVYHKMHLPNYGVFDEDRYFKPGTECPVFVINGTPVGVNICEDIWYAIGPTVVQRAAGAEVIVNINGSPFHAGKRDFREKMLTTRAADNELFVAYLNMVGGQDELVFDGASMVLDPWGDVVARGNQFVEEMMVVDIDAESVLRSRLRESRPRKENATIIRSVGTPKVHHVSDFTPVERPRPTPLKVECLDPVAEVYQALVTGTRDYVRKCGFKKVLVGLSGGIDSTIVAVIAADALGPENVVGVTMPSRFSSTGSVLDSELLATNLDIEIRTIPIEPVFAAYLESLAPHFEGTPFGTAEENLQSRIRGVFIMALSNKYGWMVLTTGNKSEMATGYATIYGDMAGGYAVIKDVPKTLVYQLCEYRNKVAGFDLIPRSVIDKPPSAELKPDQKDVDTLPPYEVLDPIIKAYVEDDRGFDDIVGMGFDAAIVKKVIRLVDTSEYKRRQAPPGIKITPRNFGRDRRMPIANRYVPF